MTSTKDEQILQNNR